MIVLRFLCLVLLGLHAAGALAGPSKQSFDYDGVMRGYELYVPPTYDGKAALPLLLVLHGRNGSGKHMEHLTGFDLRAAEHHFLVVYPDSPHRYWNYLYGIPGAPEGPDDIEFLHRLIDDVAGDYRIDRGRLYVAGISNGGFMAQRLACEKDGEFAAFASVAASAYGALPATCRARAPIDALYLHGTDDSLLPWQGQRVEGADGEPRQVSMSIADSIKYWSGLNHCDPQLEVRDLPRSAHAPETRVEVYTPQTCAGGAQVMLYGILGGGHNWPGTDGLIPPHGDGAIDNEFHASDAIWSFFEHSRPRQ